MIELKNVYKTYFLGKQEVRALNDVSLKIEDGDFVAIMGPSGSGKSTLAHILGLLDGPTSGSYLQDGVLVSNLSEDELAVRRRERIGFVFQQFHLLSGLNVLDNVKLPLLYSKKEVGSEGAKKLLTRMGLQDREEHRPNELSGGQQQRTAIARALINRPRMILADEPTGNLDSSSEKEVMLALKELNAQGITILIITHEESIGSQARRLIRMRDGKIVSDERASSDPGKTSLSLHPPQACDPTEETIVTWEDTKEYFKEGLRVLSMNKMRTGLSMLGILIGVAAVITMLAIGEGAKKAIETQFSSMGSNLLVLSPGTIRVGGVAQDSGSQIRLTIEDAEAIRDEFRTVKDVNPSASGKVQVSFRNKNWSSNVSGSSTAYPRMKASVPTRGRFFTEEENRARAKVAVLGTTVVRELFGSENPIGEMIKINRIGFQVIGVLPEKGGGGWRDPDDTIVVPVLTAMYRVLGRPYVDAIEIESIDAGSVQKTQDQVLDFMMVRKKVPLSQKEDAFRFWNMSDLRNALSESGQTMSMLLISIAAISLLVGGIGIMNILLVSVTERTKEIGLRKAIGAKKKDILFQFLAESIAVSGIGGLIGIALGVGASFAMSYFTGWNIIISIPSIVIAFVFSALIGAVFGIYPAKKASSLHPIEALRYE